MNNVEQILQAVHDKARQDYIMILSDECEVVLRDLFCKYQPKRVLEIGTAIGYSSSIMALSSQCEIDTIEKDGERVQKAKELWQKLGVADRIHSYLGDADEILQSVVKDKKYDFIFLDGAKSAYKRQLEFLYDYMQKGCVVLCDDVLYFGLVRGDEYVAHKHRTIVKNLREFLRYIEDDRFESQVIEEGNGIAIVRKK